MNDLIKDLEKFMSEWQKAKTQHLEDALRNEGAVLAADYILKYIKTLEEKKVEVIPPQNPPQ